MTIIGMYLLLVIGWFTMALPIAIFNLVWGYNQLKDMKRLNGIQNEFNKRIAIQFAMALSIGYVILFIIKLTA